MASPTPAQQRLHPEFSFIRQMGLNERGILEIWRNRGESCADLLDCAGIFKGPLSQVWWIRELRLAFPGEPVAAFLGKLQELRIAPISFLFPQADRRFCDPRLFGMGDSEFRMVQTDLAETGSFFIRYRTGGQLPPFFGIPDIKYQGVISVQCQMEEFHLPTGWDLMALEITDFASRLRTIYAEPGSLGRYPVRIKGPERIREDVTIRIKDGPVWWEARYPCSDDILCLPHEREMVL